MYHFVRELRHSRYPEIKGLPMEQFREQIEYIRKHYNIIKMEELLVALSSGNYSLPPRALLLTFDDGYADHYANVFPFFDELKIQGSFFPPAKSIIEHKVLDVNKIHFVLAAVTDKQKIIHDVYSAIDEFRSDYSLKENRWYYESFARASRFDTGDVVFIKRMMQKELPEKLRNSIVNRLFKKYVTEDETSFAGELYMSVDQLKCMIRNGMYIGSHGYDHYWLDTLDEDSQEREVNLSLNFLRDIGCDINNWVMCYPYGAYNDSLLSVLKRKGCKAGLATNVRIADLDAENPLTLPRLDTNDLPKERNARPNEWTLKVLEP